MLYLGEGVSGGLYKGAEARALAAGLPALANAKAIADAMGLALAELRFLAFDRPLSRVCHYQRFRIPKKTGGERLISAPMPRLKRVQYWILDNILAHVPVHQAAHGFAPGRSILTNAAPHVGRDVVVNLDMKDFFPTLTWKRVKGKFRGLGYSEAVATVLALVCTEPDVDEIDLDGQRLYAQARPAPPAAGRADQPGDHQPDLPAARPAPVGPRRQARLHVHALRRRHDVLRVRRGGAEDRRAAEVRGRDRRRRGLHRASR